MIRQLEGFSDLDTHLWFTTRMFGLWTLTVFVFDRFSYWRINPRPLIQVFVRGWVEELRPSRVGLEHKGA